jgi:integrase
MPARLRKRGRVWYATYYDAQGQRCERSTKQTNKAAAESVAAEFELCAVDPHYDAANKTTLNHALQLLIDDRTEQARAGRKSMATVEFYTKKTGHIRRVFGDERTLRNVTPASVDDYISTRRSEGAADNTINKELVALRASLKIASRRGLWSGELATIVPPSFGPNYKPRERHLTISELWALLSWLTDDRAARVAFIVATSASWGETVNAKRCDIAPDKSKVLLRGTKRATRWRGVPIVAANQKSLIEHTLRYSTGADGNLFSMWHNPRRDIRVACDNANIEPCSPNDLRRTFAHWMRAQHAPVELIAPAMGHADTRMVERVYGKMDPDELALRLAAAMPEHCRTFAANKMLKGADMANMTTTQNKNSNDIGQMVPRDGIEPPTRGFSVPIKTWPTPRILKRKPRQPEKMPQICRTGLRVVAS